jgi:hypothetical protein
MSTVTVTEEHLEYLDSLRESAVVNMFSAASYLINAFDLDKREAKDVLMHWMRTFGERHPQEATTE